MATFFDLAKKRSSPWARKRRIPRTTAPPDTLPSDPATGLTPPSTASTAGRTIYRPLSELMKQVKVGGSGGDPNAPGGVPGRFGGGWR